MPGVPFRSFGHIGLRAVIEASKGFQLKVVDHTYWRSSMDYLSDAEVEALREQMNEQNERLKQEKEKKRQQLHEETLKLLEGKI